MVQRYANLNTDGLLNHIDGLGLSGDILHLGAHPDDEDVGLVAYMARKHHVRIVYWSATRGEGGQNRIGREKGEALGIFRTWETLKARSIDGGEALFGPFYDFGFSKSADDALAKWGKTALIREIVRAIRTIQPQVVISRWSGGSEDGHGHHEAVGGCVLPAFEAARDPNQFPELNLPCWTPKKLYYSVGGDWQPGEDGGFGQRNPECERPGYIHINTGQYDYASGRTFQEIGWQAFNSHQTQAIGFIPEPGDFHYYYRLGKSLVETPAQESDLYDGLDQTLTGLADCPGAAHLRDDLEKVKRSVHDALADFQAHEPEKAAASLFDGLAVLQKLQTEQLAEGLARAEAQAWRTYLTRRMVGFERIITRCLGIRFEVLSDRARITPGQSFSIQTRIWRQGRIPVDLVDSELVLPKGWLIRGRKSISRPSLEKRDAEVIETTYTLTAPQSADLSCPYWLRVPRELYYYHWPNEQGQGQGLPFGPPLISARSTVKVGDRKWALDQGAVYREAFAGGCRELPIAVIPPISLLLKSKSEIFPISKERRQLEQQIVCRCNIDKNDLTGSLRIGLPETWSAEPQMVPFSFSKLNETALFDFKVTIPADAPAGSNVVHYSVDFNGMDFGVILDSVRQGAPGLIRTPDEATCVSEEFITRPSETTIHLIDAEYPERLNYAYIKGADENVVESLKGFIRNFHMITDEELGYLDLSQFEAIVAGPNAYLIREELRKNAKQLLQYVQCGGTLIVQFQGYGYQGQDFAPFPFSYSQPHDRVTLESAPVTILDPEHLIFNEPNPITARDFDGWRHDRGLYFWGRWDERYTPLLSCHDKGEAPKEGGLVVTNFGMGTYVYVGYSLFKQLESGVPGAFRLFANLLALPDARIKERTRILKNASLFQFMSSERLYDVARIVSEQWIEKGKNVFRQGERGDELYYIVEGRVEVVKESDEQKVLHVARPGDWFGEFSVLAEMPRTATLRVVESARLLVIKGTDFRSLIHRNPDMTDGIIRMLVNKLAL